MTDYSEVVVDDEKDPTEYSYVERRAVILARMEEKGHPHGFNKSKLGRELGVSESQIRKDFDKLKDFYRERIGTGAKTMSDMAYRRVVQSHLENGDLEKARKALDSWNSWMFDIGAQEKEPDKQEITGEDGGPVEVENAVPDSVVEAVVSSSKGRLDDNADADAGQDQPEDTDTQQTDE